MLIDQRPILKGRCQLIFENFNYKPVHPDDQTQPFYKPASHRVHWNLKTWFLYSEENGKAKRCVPWVPETFHARFPVSVKSYKWPESFFWRLRRSFSAEGVSACGRHPAKAPRRTREKTSGTQGRFCPTSTYIYLPTFAKAKSHACDCFLPKFPKKLWQLLPWVPEVFLAFGGNQRPTHLRP